MQNGIGPGVPEAPDAGAATRGALGRGARAPDAGAAEAVAGRAVARDDQFRETLTTIQASKR